MQDYKKDFIEFSIEHEVLRFGEFVLKSGRNSPYFFNSGLFNSGKLLAKLGQFYAESIKHSGIQFDMLFGPAYKGIPLVAAVAIASYELYGTDIPYAFNRKEAKDHGEGGTIVGADLKGRVLVIDDVISAGTSVRESVDIINAQHAVFTGVSIAVDRKERGSGTNSAIAEIESQYDIKVASIITIEDIIDYLKGQGETQKIEKMQQYRDEYGV